MSLTQAAASFRVFQFDARLDASVLKAFAENAIPPLETLNEEPLVGWATPRFLVDREINDDTCHAGKFLHLSLAKAQRKNEAIILSMTRMERRNPDILNASRKRRVAAGSGTTVQDVNLLLKQFDQARSMMKSMMGAGKRGRMKIPFGKMPKF